MNFTLACEIHNCSFQRNTAKEAGGAACFLNVKLTINGSMFDNNSAVLGGAISTSSRFTGLISNCSFTNNNAILHGGALNHIGTKLLLIITSNFQNNTVLGKSGQGGALFTESFLYYNFPVVEILQCIFDGNQASMRGGAIMASKNSLFVINSSFRSSFSIHSEGYSGGDHIYSKSYVHLKYVSFLDVDRHNLHSSLIVHQNVFIMPLEDLAHQTTAMLTLSFHAGVHVQCLQGKIMTAHHTYEKSLASFTWFSVSCSFCPQNFYSLYKSHMDYILQNQSAKTNNAKCLSCPMGGVCKKGQVRAAENFWGYISRKEVRFAACPFGYCCFKNECVTYSSCSTGRTGTLCSQCAKGLTENLITPDCLPQEKCGHPWYLPVVIICGILYVVVLLYLNEATEALKFLLIPSFVSEHFKHIIKAPFKMSRICKHIWQAIKLKFKDEFYRGSGIQYMMNDVSVEETESEERPEDTLGDLELVCDDEMPPSTELGKDSEDNTFPGLLKIIIFFYQVNILFKIYSGSKSHGFAHVLQEVVSTLFNLQINGAFTQELSRCPFHNLKPVSKVLLKGSFIICLFLLICLAYVLSRTRKLFRSTSARLNNSRIICCTVRLIFISYAGITTSFFSLLSCVHLGHIGKVLFMDGSITCYKWLQVLVICVICCWTIPFPVTIYTTSQLLHKNMLSMRQFLICLLFPLPAIMYWLYNRCKDDWRKSEVQRCLIENIRTFCKSLKDPFES